MNEQNISPPQMMMLIFVSVFSQIILLPFFPLADGSVTAVFAAFLPAVVLLYVLFAPVSFCRKAASYLRCSSMRIFIVILYGLFFLYISSYSVFQLCGFCDNISDREINRYIVVIALFSGAFFAALRGIETSARFSAVAFILVIASLVFFSVFTFPAFSPGIFGEYNIKPDGAYLQSVFYMLSLVPHAAALMFYSGNISGSVSGSLYRWLSVCAVLLSAILILICGAAGHYLDGVKYPIFHAIDASGELQRFDTVFIAVTVCCTFCGVSLALTVVRDSVRRIVPDSRISGYIFVFLAVFSVSAGIFLYDSAYGAIVYSHGIMTLLTVLFVFVIPFALVLKCRVGILRRRGIKGAFTAVLALILIPAVLCSCTALQLNRKLIIQGISIDRNDSGYYISCVVLDTQNENGDNEVRIVSCEGSSVPEAFDQLERSYGSRIMLSQCLLIISDRQALRYPEETLGYFCDSNEIMKNVNLMESDGSAVGIMQKAVGELGYTCESINMLTDPGAVRRQGERYTLFDLITESKAGEKKNNIPVIAYDERTGTVRVK